MIENVAADDHYLRGEAIEQEGNGGNLLLTDTQIDATMKINIKKAELEIADNFNKGIVKTDRVYEGSVVMARTMAEHSSSTEGFLTFISAHARATLPSLSSVQPKRIRFFEYISDETNRKASVPGISTHASATISNLSPVHQKRIPYVQYGTDKKNSEVSSNDDDMNDCGDADEMLSKSDKDAEQTMATQKVIARPLPQYANGIASAKSAAAQAFTRIEKDNQYILAAAGTGYNPGDSLLHERFGAKHLVYPADIQFYRDHLSFEAMVAKYEADELLYEGEIGVTFEWFITSKMSEDEIALRDKIMSERAESSVRISKMCDELFEKKRLDEYNEIITRKTNENRRKQELADFERRARAELKERSRRDASAKKDEEDQRVICAIYNTSKSFLTFLVSFATCNYRRNKTAERGSSKNQ